MQWKSCGSARALSRRQKLREGRHQAAGPPVDRHHPDRFAGRDGTVPGDTPQEDDVTLVVLEKNKQGKGPSSPLRRGRPDGVLLTSRVSPHACNVLGSKPRKDPQAEKGSSTPILKQSRKIATTKGSASLRDLRPASITPARSPENGMAAFIRPVMAGVIPGGSPLRKHPRMPIGERCLPIGATTIRWRDMIFRTCTNRSGEGGTAAPQAVSPRGPFRIWWGR